MDRHFRVAAGTSAGTVLVRNLAPTNGALVQNDNIVIYVHGATFPSALSIGYRFDGHSWMDDLSAAGFDVWAFDFTGFGESSRYPEMREPAEANPPLGRLPDSCQELAEVVNFVCEQRGFDCISLIAHSRGTLVAGRFATSAPERIDRLVLFGPIARRGGAAPPAAIPAYRLITAEAQWSRFSGEVPAGHPAVFAERHFAEWAAAYLATDPESSGRMPPSVKVPAGPYADIAAAWSGDFPYDPAAITAPTLIVRGEWDTLCADSDAGWLLKALSAAPSKQDVVIDRGTHVMHLEESRYQLYREVQRFLEERPS